VQKLLFILLVFVSLACKAQVYADPDQSFTLSKQTNKPVLLVFSGTDWCVPCMQFERHILSDTVFLNYAKGHLVILKADFPQKAKVAPNLKRQYELLADQYDPNGDFPLIVLLDTDKKNIGNVLFIDQGVFEFIKQVQRLIP